LDILIEVLVDGLVELLVPDKTGNKLVIELYMLVFSILLMGVSIISFNFFKLSTCKFILLFKFFILFCWLFLPVLLADLFTVFSPVFLKVLFILLIIVVDISFNSFISFLISLKKEVLFLYTKIFISFIFFFCFNSANSLSILSLFC
jgi:hypothetical protein